jgi:hypothetical protein
MLHDELAFPGKHCKVMLRRLGSRVLLLEISGRDIGEHGDRPMVALAGLLPASGEVELFIDARRVLGATTDVSAAWALWLAQRRSAFSHINMLTGSRFVQLTADFVRKWAELQDTMRVYTDAAAFESALTASTALPAKCSPSVAGPRRQHGS